jgi:hypothetical protein
MTNTAEKDMKWFDAIVYVLQKTGRAMHYSEIADEIQQQKLRRKVGATPAATVNVCINSEINTKGHKSLFVPVGKGQFVLRGFQESTKEDLKESKAAVPTSSTDEEDILNEVNSIQAFGMFWQRSEVNWTTIPKLMGAQSPKSEPVNFCDQKGVYILYDGRTIVYVGRATDRPLGQRLNEHTTDALNGRWDRFSWFGLKKVSEQGQLRECNFSLKPDQVIKDFEALLIASLEPPLNWRRGDRFRVIEYIQRPDPDREKKQSEQLIQKLLKKLRDSD